MKTKDVFKTSSSRWMFAGTVLRSVSSVSVSFSCTTTWIFPWMFVLFPLILSLALLINLALLLPAFLQATLLINVYKSRALRGYLKCSIWGTNNQLWNRFYKFVHLLLFNVKYKFVQLQLFDVKFLFSEKYIFCKQNRTAVYGRASLVLGFKLTGKNDDLLSSRYK